MRTPKVRMIVNYFTLGENSYLKCEIWDCETVEEGQARIDQLIAGGIWITDAHYGFYLIKNDLGPIVEISKPKRVA